MQTIKFWFRQKYNLPPTDPRYLDMTIDGIVQEYELDLASSGEPLKTCPKCDWKTYRRECPACKLPDGTPLSLSGNSQIDDVQARLESGEEIEDLESILRAGFAPVPRGAI